MGLGGAESGITAELRPGEHLLWWGRPDPSVRFARADAWLIPFTLLWAGFAVFWNMTVWSTGAPIEFRIFGLPFLLVGIYVVVGRFVVKARRKKRTTYGLTGSRAIICAPPNSITSIPLQNTPIDRQRSRDGKHLSVVFGVQNRSTFGRRSAPVNTGLDLFGGGQTPGFFDVADADELERALRSLPHGNF